MLLNCRDAFNHFYIKMVVCVWPLPSSVLIVYVVDMAHIKYNHSDITLFFFGVLDRASVWEQAQTLPCCNGSAATLWLSLQFDGQTWL